MSELAPYLDKQMQIRAAILSELHKRFEHHRGQRIVSHALHVLGAIFIFIQCGRKWGKTELEGFEGVQNCMLPINEGQTTMYVAPEDDQAQKIVWNERRILKFCHPSWVKKVYESDMLIEFHNDRLFQVDGSNNYKKHEGLRPSMLLLDEFKRFRPEFWQIAEPNLSVYDAPVIFAGVPPDCHCQYVEIAELVKDRQANGRRGFFTEQPSWMNDKTPRLIPWLKERYEDYVRRGELHIWHREYGAKYTPGGTRRIFPKYDRARLQRSGEFLKKHISDHANEWDFYCLADPANNDPFAVLLAAIQRSTRRIAWLDGLYQTDRSLTTVQAMWKDILERVMKWNPRIESWQFFYDDQAAWWPSEYQSQIPDGPNKVGWSSVGKLAVKKETGISIVNGVIGNDLLWVNESMEMCHREMERYQTKEDGTIPKGNDHFCDLGRYCVVASHYDPNVEMPQEYPEEYKNDPWLMTAIRQQEGLDTSDLEDDWTHDMFNDWAGVTFL